MKKIGTISAACGFIFMGIWMVLRNVDKNLAQQVFNFWPMIIILLGIEILIYFSRKEENSRLGMNYLIIPVIIIFIAINIFQFVYGKVEDKVKWFSKNPTIGEFTDFLKGIDADNYKIIYSNRNISKDGKELTLLINNGDIKVKKSKDKDIKLESKLYVDKDSKESEYNIKEEKDFDGYKVEMKDIFIKKVEVYVYLPEGYNLKIEGNNLKVQNEEELLTNAVNINANNGSAEMLKLQSFICDINNGSIKVNDIKKINIKSNNASININGEAEEINIDADNGVVNVNNKICKDINIDLSLGTVKLNTEDKNLDIKAEINHGAIDVNGVKIFNSPFNKTINSGESKVKIKVNNGAVNVKSQE